MDNLMGPRSKEEISSLIKEWEESKLSKKAFCEQKRINYQTFIGWMVQRRNRIATSEKRFVPVQVEAKTGQLFAEIHLSGTRKVILYSTVSAEFIQAIIKC